MTSAMRVVVVVIPASVAAQRASISRTTLVKIEKGDPGVAMGHYSTVLFVM